MRARRAHDPNTKTEAFDLVTVTLFSAELHNLSGMIMQHCNAESDGCRIVQWSRSRSHTMSDVIVWPRPRISTQRVIRVMLHWALIVGQWSRRFDIIRALLIYMKIFARAQYF